MSTIEPDSELDQLFGTRGMTQEQLKAAIEAHYTNKLKEALGEPQPDLASNYMDTQNMGLPLQAIQTRNQFRTEILAKWEGRA